MATAEDEKCPAFHYCSLCTACCQTSKCERTNALKIASVKEEECESEQLLTPHGNDTSFSSGTPTHTTHGRVSLKEKKVDPNQIIQDKVF